ncbi:MAG TPA: GMC oxidoreductase, partial [Gaiellaceae bacterium]|nr:GMC oxidoreductase [Gaiellaceae bacterium]
LPVGHNLQDHCMVQLNYETDEPSLFGTFTPANVELFEREGRGPLTSNIPEAGAFLRTRPELPAPDIEFHYAPSMFYDEGLTAPHAGGYCFGPVVVKPTSRGRVMLRAPLADSKPRVLCNFLTTEEDRRSMIAGIRMALEIAEQAPLKKVARTAFSVPAGDSDEEIMHWVRRAAQSVYHPTSTCAIGSVVDPQLRVYGVDGLRVVDASVMPTVTRANTNAAAIMIAEKAADLIAERTLEPISLEENVS